jgi:site-specific DNA-methyltransferase (adenine-specific)
MSLTPYYEHGGIVIYHGDCREVLPEVWFGVDLLLTDPPYGIAVETDNTWRESFSRGKRKAYAPVHGDDKPFDPRHLLAYGSRFVLWGANHYANSLPESRGWLIWNKRDLGKSGMHSDAELAWTNFLGVTRCHNQFWQGAYRVGEPGEFYHPTQKPVALMRWCIELAAPVSKVIDPYMGSGSALVAAKEMGVPAIGIEIEERYCEIAAKRLQQEVLPLEVPCAS